MWLNHLLCPKLAFAVEGANQGIHPLEHAGQDAIDDDDAAMRWAEFLASIGIQPSTSSLPSWSQSHHPHRMQCARRASCTPIPSSDDDPGSKIR